MVDVIWQGILAPHSGERVVSAGLRDYQFVTGTTLLPCVPRRR